MNEETPEIQETQVEAPAAEVKAFQPIISQAELDVVIKQRITRERAKYAGFEDFKSKAAAYDELANSSKAQIEAATARAEAAEAELAVIKATAEVVE